MSDNPYKLSARHNLAVRTLSIVMILAMLLTMLAFRAPAPVGAVGNIEEIHEHENQADVDNRVGSIQPNSTQLALAQKLGATTRWNKFGTPQSMVNHNGWIAKGLQGRTAVEAAFGWIAANKALFRLNSVTPSTLKLLNDSRMTNGIDPATGNMRYSGGHAVMFRQWFGGIESTHDGMVTVGITGSPKFGWNIAYVSSSISGNTTLAAQPKLTPTAAWQLAAKAVGFNVPATEIGAAQLDKNKNGTLRSNWKLITVKGFLGPQRARLTAIPTPTNGVRPAYETIVLRIHKGDAEAYTSFVDAVSGAILFRANNVQQLADTAPTAAPTATAFNGTYTKSTCGRNGPYTVPSGTRSIIVFASAVLPANDIVLKLFKGATEVASMDTATSPEVIVFEPDGGVQAGNDYFVEVCSFEGADPLLVGAYSGTFTTSEQSANNANAFPPKWKYFRANPPIIPEPFSTPTRDTRIIACYDKFKNDTDGGNTGTVYPGCENAQDLKYVGNDSSRVPHDHLVQSNTPSFTTSGNNAQTAEAHFSPLTPAPTAFRPVSANREYFYRWSNQWNTSQCNPLPPNGPNAPTDSPDLSAATTNLFVFHNRMHDWSYHLGFTEENFNMQVNNFGLTSPSRENDPEVGNVQAGARDGGPPSYLGRDNANQITLNDGIAPITNMYLWQPIVAAFYAPCVDGDYDMSVVGHEYGHAIQNRMVGGPDGGLSSEQGRQMGESWSDLTAVEFLASFGYSMGLDRSAYPAGVNPFAVGPYVTGAVQTGIRNYGMNRSPLNYSNLEYDPNGPASASPHSNGEIWSATNYNIRQALVAKYNVPRFGLPAFPSSDLALQQDCAAGRRPDRFCPGNRRWIQIFHDAFLLLPGAISMLDARDAYLAADRMRFSGFNQKELWRAFAQRGMGIDAKSREVRRVVNPDTMKVTFETIEGGNARSTIPSFRSPLETSTRVKFVPVALNEGNKPIQARLFVGDYEARSEPYADTFPMTADPTNNEVGDTARFAPGTYNFLVQAPGYGHFRFTRTIAPVTSGPEPTFTFRVALASNFASRARGARAITQADEVVASPPSGSPTGRNRNLLIDDSEATNFRGDRSGQGDIAPESSRSIDPAFRGVGVSVKLGGDGLTTASAPIKVRTIRRVQVSASLRPADLMDQGNDDLPGQDARNPKGLGDTETQGRFTALRQFRIDACTATAAQPSRCRDLANYTPKYTSPEDAFPSGRPRSLVPQHLIRNFDVPDFTATHVRIVALDSQCTGAPVYNIVDGDNDPTNPNVQCRTFNGNLSLDPEDGLPEVTTLGRSNNKVRIAELQVFSSFGTITVTRNS